MSTINSRIRFIFFLSGACALFCHSVSAQERRLTLAECQQLALEHYPLNKQRELVAKSGAYSVANASRGSLPAIGIFGQASYQSDVTRIPISLPGVDIPEVPKEQFRIYGELNQPLTDLVTVRRQRALEEINANIQSQSLEVELYSLRDRVNQLFFGVLLLDAQIAQNNLVRKDLQSAMEKAKISAEFGTALLTAVDKLKAELLRIEQRALELNATRQAYRDMLGSFIGQRLSENDQLVRPEYVDYTSDVSARPEMRLFNYEGQRIAAREKLLSARNLPKFSLFLQAGFGQPSPVNMLEDDFSSYYIGGLRLHWPLSSFYTSSNERQMLVINQSMIDLRKETFLFNTQLEVTRHEREIEKLRSLINRDDEIIALRTSIKQTASVQLQNGVITANDFIAEVNAEDQARQAKLLHEIQLLMTARALGSTTGQAP